MPSENFKDVSEFRDGAIFDFNSCLGQVRMFLTFVFLFVLVWWAPDWLTYIDIFLGLEPHKFTDGEVRVGRFWALVFGGGGMLLTLLRIIFLLFRSRLKETIGDRPR
jgi:hypothetical protein